MKKKLALILSVVIVFGVTVGATLAWLQDTTQTVTNTFTVGDIDITLTETGATDTNDDELGDAKSYKMIPGKELDKDPTVTVAADSEACWLFVEVVKTNIPEWLTYSIAAGWIELEDGVYYRKVAASEDDQPFAILENNKVYVSEDATKAQLGAVDGTTVSLAFKAYAVQQEEVTTPATAWAIAKQ